MFKQFYPDVRYDSVYEIDFEKYYEIGYRALLFDIDNTLVEHDAKADERSAALIGRLHDIGFKTCLISNNDDGRVAPFAKAVGSGYICNAAKPDTSGIKRALDMLNVSKDQAMMIGDQLFTDMWSAKRAGIFALCTKRIAKDPIFYIRLKRLGEGIVLFFYNFYKLRHHSEMYLIEKKD